MKEASETRREEDWDVCGTCRRLMGDATVEGKGWRQGQRPMQGPGDWAADEVDHR